MFQARLSQARKIFAFAATSSLFAFAASTAQASYNQSLTQSVTTANSTTSLIQGQIDPNNSGAQRFLGIPFAAPPVGALRWHAPADPAAWSGTRSATAFGNQCAQVSGLFDPSENPATFGTVTGSEDCLYINVFRPNTSASNLPVMYWIYGGANLAGGANDPVYEGANFAVRNNVVVVTVNYRLGMLGFLYESALHTGSNTALDNSGNFATLDLVKGLTWVNNNITTFGGNKGNITIGGQSAGCIDTWGLVQTPLAAGKFQKAICMSGLPNMYPTALGQGFAGQMEDGVLMSQNPGMTLAQADALRLSMTPTQIASLLNNATAAQILLNTPQPVNPGHFQDGTVIPSMTSGILANSYNKVPMILGSVNNEGNLFIGLGGGWQVSQQTMWSMINTGTPTPSDAAIVTPSWQQASGKAFSSSPYAEGSQMMSNLVVYMTDMINVYLQDPVFFPPTVYRYHFQWQNQPQPWVDIYGSEHAMDVPFVFGNFKSNNFLAYAWTSANQTDRTDLSNLMNSYYANFLWNGNPNTTSNNPHPYSSAPNWSSWSNTGILGIGAGERMMLNASLGKANAGASSGSSNTTTLFEGGEAFSSILTLPPVAVPYVESFLGSFIPQEWLTELGLSIP